MRRDLRVHVIASIPNPVTFVISNADVAATVAADIRHEPAAIFLAGLVEIFVARRNSGRKKRRRDRRAYIRKSVVTLYISGDRA